MVDTNPGNVIDLTGDNRHELTIDWEAVKRDPQARQRVHSLFEIAFSILRREGLLGKGLTIEQVREALRSKRNDAEKSGKNSNITL